MTTPTPRETALAVLRYDQASLAQPFGDLPIRAAIAWLDALPDDVGEYGVRAFEQGAAWSDWDGINAPDTAEAEARRLLAEGKLGRAEA